MKRDTAPFNPSPLLLRMAMLLLMATPGPVFAETGGVGDKGRNAVSVDTVRSTTDWRRHCDAGCVQYLYINANVGVSAGGHSALRIGNRVYHFQLHPDGIFHIERDDWDDFRYNYGILQNRTIHFQRLLLSRDDLRKIRDAFDLRYLVQGERLGALAELRAQRFMLRKIDSGGTGVYVEGAGLFAKDGISPSMRELARFLERNYSLDLRGRLREAERRLVSISIESMVDQIILPQPGSPGALTEFQGRSPLLREELAALLQKRRALQILLEERPLDEQAFQAPFCDSFSISASSGGSGSSDGTGSSGGHGSPHPLPVADRNPFLGSFRHRLRRMAVPFHPANLTAKERAGLEGLRFELQSQIARLLVSDDPGTDLALLLAMGRYEAASLSLRRGCLHLLLPTTLPVAAADNSLPGATEGREMLPSSEELENFLDDARRNYINTEQSVLRTSGGTGGIDELALLRLERAAARFHLLERGIRIGKWSGLAASAIPDRPAMEELPAAILERIRSRPELADSTDRAFHIYRDALRRVYPYELIRSNCTTELLRVMNGALGGDSNHPDGPDHPDDPVALRHSRRSLVDPDSNFHYIPFVAFRAVGQALPIAETGEYPSYRRIMMDRMSHRESRARLFLRESNTVTSRIYRRNDTDSWFLFFTDEPVWPRPLFGLFNFGAGIGETLYGAGRAPFDKGDEFLKGIRGFFFSGPELLFFNVRKGSFEWVSRSILRREEAAPISLFYSGTSPARSEAPPGRGRD